MSDFRDALRALRGTPVVSVVAVLSLALGIGANTAIFSILNALMLRSLPVKQPQELVQLMLGQNRASWSNPLWEQLRDHHANLFDGAFAFSHQRFDLAHGGEAEFVNGVMASGGLFDVLGVAAILGRTFTAADDVKGGGKDGPVAVISYRFWQRRFGGAADAIGKPLLLDIRPAGAAHAQRRRGNHARGFQPLPDAASDADDGPRGDKPGACPEPIGWGR